MIRGKMPDITPAQIAALLTFVVTQLVAFGVVDDQTAQVLISAGGSIIAASWKIADAYLRAHRALAVAQNSNITDLPTVPAPDAAAGGDGGGASG